MPPGRRACDFHQSGTCMYGENCRFIHIGPAGSARADDSFSGGRSAEGLRATANLPPFQPGAGPATRSEFPRGVCGEFWRTGDCDRGFHCRFKHVKADGSSRDPGDAAAAVPISIDADALDRITTATDVFSHASKRLSPTQAHNFLLGFLRDGHKFGTLQERYKFVGILSSCSSENASWTLTDGQTFLNKIADPEGNGLQLIGQIFRHEEVSSSAVRGTEVLSFQKGYIPLLSYLTSHFVIKSILEHRVNGLYSVVDESFEKIVSTLTKCMEESMSRKSFSDSANAYPLSGFLVFRSLATFLYQYITRFKQSITVHPSCVKFIHDLMDWFLRWEPEAIASSPEFADPPAGLDASERLFVVGNIKKDISTLVEIAARIEGCTPRQIQSPNTGTKGKGTTLALIATVAMTYVGPGDIRPDGPRHDNDFRDIQNIKIAPTHDELTSPYNPYLPANLPGVQHHLPLDSMERLVDIHFRLLREELIAPVRTAINLVLEDLKEPNKKTPLHSIIGKRGGVYKTSQDDSDSVVFNVYTGVIFNKLECHTRRGLSVDVSFDAPPGKSRDLSPDKRVAYWEVVGKKRLMRGGLMAFIWDEGIAAATPAKAYLGTVTSTLDELLNSCKNSPSRVTIRVSFFESEVELRILRTLQKDQRTLSGQRLLIEAPVMYESIRPFLETLKHAEPLSIPFSRYLSHPVTGDLSGVNVDLPLYARRPRFEFDLSCLLDPPAPFSFCPNNTDAVAAARGRMKEDTRLDPSQADALIDALTSELSLIQGPPGTGKSFTGIELLRVLISNNLGPILLIAFTNHALDHILLDVLKGGIAKKVIRLGSRGNEELGEYTLEAILTARGRSKMDKAASSEFRLMKETEKEMVTLMDTITHVGISEPDMDLHLEYTYPNHHEEIVEPPFWIQERFNEETTWSRGPRTLLKFWVQGADLVFITPPSAANQTNIGGAHGKWTLETLPNRYQILQRQPPQIPDGDHSAEIPSEDTIESWEDKVTSFFRGLNLPGVPSLPDTNRPLNVLREDSNVWGMAILEREVLFAFWVQEVRESEHANQEAEFARLKDRHSGAKERWEAINDAAKLDILSKAELIGCTTNGAAKLASLLKNVAPRILLVEEAGQVLEAHVLASLVPSIEHLILIGDPLQLRPTLGNYHLSVDNPKSGQLYRLDLSSMERLSSMEMRMSMLNEQRRMRPSISNLIRRTLYPSLVDHAVVQNYPPVRGLSKNIFFLDHRHREQGGGEESVSKANTFEALMIKDLVLHLLKQGIYSNAGRIVVLCAYLGQLVKIRKLLSKEVTTVIDDRDTQKLIEQGEDAEVMHQQFVLDRANSKVHVSKQVLIRTVDNFQGEEGDVVILSLVRNSGQEEHRETSIGFLKSENRTNVALSRAKHGLYILGNAEDLKARSTMWRDVVEQLEEYDQIGDSFPIVCNRHPDVVSLIRKPGEIPRYSPDGGCLLPCGARLHCGHQCPRKCHPDDEDHVYAQCDKNCPKLCMRLHPCSKTCSTVCGDCTFLVRKILDCGHENEVPCFQLDKPEEIRCTYPIEKKLPTCEHSARTTCSTDPAQIRCEKSCDREMSCCSATCRAMCGECQRLNPNDLATVNPRHNHFKHPCTKMLVCQHTCRGDCSEDHDCSRFACRARCRQSCPHHTCRQLCSKPCAPCMEPCTWKCRHYSCPVACGAPCARLPCDSRCEETLKCGHRCPSVCGEPCASQICSTCATDTAKEQEVDPVSGKTLGAIDPLGNSLGDLLITLSCRHVFTVETLDLVCEVDQYYRLENEVWTSLAEPPQGLQKRPVCPLCRGPITSMRYGRVFKRADLDLSQQNIGSTSRRLLQRVSEQLESFDVEDILQGMEAVLNAMPPSPMTRFLSSAGGELPRSGTLLASAVAPVNTEAFRNLTKWHQIPRILSFVWDNMIHPLTDGYRQAVFVANRRSSHVEAYEAAVTMLSKNFLIAMEENPEDIPISSPADYALERAKAMCGFYGPPRADLRFRVEALWATINTRFIFIVLAEGFLEILNKLDGATADVLARWRDFMTFIAASIQHDGRIALQTAEKSLSHRQVIKTTLLLMEADFQAYRLRASQIQGRPTHYAAALPTLKAEADRGCTTAKRTVRERSTGYCVAMDQRMSDLEWLKNNFTEPANAIINKWVDLRERLEVEGFAYSPVSDEEKRDIVRALMQNTRDEIGLTTRGHFFQCRNGHIYMIADCGGAREESRCPECGSVIGGRNHNLNSSNQRAMDLEQIAGEQGLGPSPWAWGRGA